MQLKPGQQQLVSQAWAPHRREQLLISCSPGQVREAMEAEHYASCRRAMNETFVMEIPLLAAEAVVPVDMVSRWVQVRGHTVAGPYLHGSAYDLTLQAHRRAVLADLRRERPYFLVLFSATTSWDRLAKMTKTGDELRQERSFHLGPPGARTNSRGETRLSSFSSAWRAPALKRLQRSFGLRSVDVAGHRLLASSQAVISKFLDPAVVMRQHKVWT